MLQDRFLEILLQYEVLAFGEFKTKSGRLSPYFFNTGRLCTGKSLWSTAQIYATAIQEIFGTKVTNLFGPAYKGITLASATACALHELYQRDVSFTYNRKEAKDHGEGGNLVGQPYNTPQKVVIVEDVLTAGTSVRESLALLRNYPVQVIGVLVGIDRQEKGSGSKSACEEIVESFGIPVHAVITLDSIIERLYGKTVLNKVWIDDPMKAKIDSYRANFA